MIEKKDYAEISLAMHYEKKGKIEVISRVSADTKDALSTAYTPGVARFVTQLHLYFVQIFFTCVKEH